MAIVTKFPSAFDANTGEIVPFRTVRREFFAAANAEDPKKSINELRRMFNLVCPHCKQAKLVFSFGSQNPDGTVRKIAGSRVKGKVAHLQTLPKAEHASGCIGTVFESEGHEINDQKGFRIHLNLRSIPEYNPKNSQLVRRERNGRIITLDPDLKDREPWELSRPEKIVPLIRSKQNDRLNDSVVIYGDTKTPWRKFYIPHASDDHFDGHLSNIAQTLAKKMLNGGRTAATPLLVVLDFKGASVTRTADENGNQKNYLFPKIRNVDVNNLTDDKDGMTIVPEMKVKNEHLFEMMRQLQISRGKLLVIAENPVLYKRDSRTNVYHLSFSITDPTMIHAIEINNGVMASVKRNQNTKESSPQPSMSASLT